MNSDFVWDATKVWHCAYCEARNVTIETDVFSDQCENCTCYNEIDWDETGDLSLTEAQTAAERMEAE